MNKIKELLEKETPKLTGFDFVVALVIVVLYGALSFMNLGDTVAPQTFATVNNPNDTIEIKTPGNDDVITFMRIYTGIAPGEFDILTSEDGVNYELLGNYTFENVFGWQDINIGREAKYIKFVLTSEEGSIGEVALYDIGDYLLNDVTYANDLGKLIVDEVNTVPQRISYMNSSYFDEIYFARTAYDYANGVMAYEWVHPPVGKLIQAIPILIMGMTPFAWRFAGNVFGILMVFLVYLFAKRIFKKTSYATVAALLVALDNFHFAQTRMGTIDTELVVFSLLSIYFMYEYIVMDKSDPLIKKLRYLFMSGLFFGLTISTKWSGAFTGLLICIMFFQDFIRENLLKNRRWTKNSTKILLSCFLFFLVIPALIYVSSYLLFPNVGPFGSVRTFSEFTEQIHQIFAYHSGLTEGHPFSSNWYTWPLLVKPVWLHVAYYPNDLIETINEVGNPLIWWCGAIAMLVVLIRSFIKKDKTGFFLIGAVACMWLPYIFIGRCMFLYHFFPAYPFMILTLTYLLKILAEKYNNKSILWIFIFAAFMVFVVFMPVSSGRLITETYTDFLRWLPGWYFHN